MPGVGGPQRLFGVLQRELGQTPHLHRHRVGPDVGPEHEPQGTERRQQRTEAGEDVGPRPHHPFQQPPPGEYDIDLAGAADQLCGRLLHASPHEHDVGEAASAGLAYGTGGGLTEKLPARLEPDDEPLRMAAGIGVGEAAVAGADVNRQAVMARDQALEFGPTDFDQLAASDDAHAAMIGSRAQEAGTVPAGLTPSRSEAVAVCERAKPGLRMRQMAFEGWRGDFIGFFRGLEMDNSKPYFDAHRQQYELEVRRPLEELVAELEPLLGPGKIFRINRDIRFSADKSPYKTNVAAVIGRLYFHLDAHMLYLAAGSHMPDSAWLARYREAVAGEAGEELARLVDQMRAAGLSVGGNELKTTPRGYPPDHPRIELLRWREVGVGRSFPLEPWIATPAVRDRVLETWEKMRPLPDWLAEHVTARP